VRVNGKCIAGPDDTLLGVPCCLKALFETVFVVFHLEELTRYGCVHVVLEVVISGLPDVRSRKVFYRGNRKCGKTSRLGSVEHRVASVSVSVGECAAQPQQVTVCECSVLWCRP